MKQRLKHQLIRVKPILLSILITGCLFVIANAEAMTMEDDLYAQPLTNPQMLAQALNHGATVNATIDLSLCAPVGDGSASKTKGGLVVSPFRITEDGTISFADTHQTVSSRTGAPLVQTLKYQVLPDGSITLKSYIFTIPDYGLMGQSEFDCQMGQAMHFYVR